VNIRGCVWHIYYYQPIDILHYQEKINQQCLQKEIECNLKIKLQKFYQ